MSGMMDLLTWLRVQLDEDDAVIARNPGQAGLGDSASYPDYQTYDGSDIDAACDYLGQFTPPRMAAEVEAKRRILALCESHADAQFPDSYGGYASAMEDAVQILALPYADRPGYREEWRPVAPA
jgi:hypothetical protein